MIEVETMKPVMNTKQLAISIIFGALAFVARASQLAIPIGGPFVIDLRGIFMVIGAAYSGPIGGIITGILAGIPAKYPFVDIPSFGLAGFLVGLVVPLIPKHKWLGALLTIPGFLLAPAITTLTGFTPTYLIGLTFILPRMAIMVPLELIILFLALKGVPLETIMGKTK